MTTKKTNNTPAKSMAELLATHKSSVISFQKGQSITGVIVKLTSGEILVDILGKTNALAIEKDRQVLKQMLKTLKVGDHVTGKVITPESDKGQTIISLRPFMENVLWDKLDKLYKNQEQIEMHITEITKGGYLVASGEGIDGFLPNSHVSFSATQKSLVGTTIPLVIMTLDREEHKILFSQKNITSGENFSSAKKQLKVGKKIHVLVSNIASFGIFVSVPLDEKNIYVDGLIHISEVSWEQVNNLTGLFSSGEEVEAVIIGFDSKAKRIELSIKRLTGDPFTEKVKEYAVDQKVKAIVKSINDTGIVFSIGKEEDGIEGFMRKDKIPPTIVFEVGQVVTTTIAQIDTKKRRIVLLPVLLEKPMGYR